MPFTSRNVPRTLSARHAWLSKRVGRSTKRHRESVAILKTKNNLSEALLRQLDDKAAVSANETRIRPWHRRLEPGLRGASGRIPAFPAGFRATSLAHPLGRPPSREVQAGEAAQNQEQNWG
jgi:hypothetical protein